MKIKSISDIGLLYCKNEYDLNRYTELQEISYSIMEKLSGHDMASLRLSFPAVKDYPTAKVDIRGLVINENDQVLLARESEDGKWSLPGGWADIGFSPRETVIKELREETGLEVAVNRLLAVFDKKMHPHPPQPQYVYKLVFYCTAISSTIGKGFDVLDVQYFDMFNLPPLSEDRILKSQIELLYNKVKQQDADVYFD